MEGYGTKSGSVQSSATIEELVDVGVDARQAVFRLFVAAFLGRRP